MLSASSAIVKSVGSTTLVTDSSAETPAAAKAVRRSLRGTRSFAVIISRMRTKVMPESSWITGTVTALST